MGRVEKIHREQLEGVVGEEEGFVTAFVNQFKNDADLATKIDDDSCMEEVFRFRFTCNDDKDLIDKMVNNQDFEEYNCEIDWVVIGATIGMKRSAIAEDDDINPAQKRCVADDDEEECPQG